MFHLAEAVATAAVFRSFWPFGSADFVVRRYQHQIYVKLIRAVRGTLEEEDESFDEFAKDSGGSAKVALIGMEP